MIQSFVDVSERLLRALVALNTMELLFPHKVAIIAVRFLALRRLVALR